MTVAIGPIVRTEFGRVRRVNREQALENSWMLECPGCGEWAYLDHDQWHGLVSVDHAADGCPGGYHETHDFALVLAVELPGSLVEPMHVRADRMEALDAAS